MARGASFFRNPLRWIGDKLAPPPPERRGPPREPPREPPPPRGPTGPGDFYRRIWDQEVTHRQTRRTSRETGYSRNEQFQLHAELFAGTGMTDLEPAEQRQAWRDYLDSFVRSGNTKRTHEGWLRRWGVDPRSFDWAAWRAAMGYRHRGDH